MSPAPLEISILTMPGFNSHLILFPVLDLVPNSLIMYLKARLILYCKRRTPYKILKYNNTTQVGNNAHRGSNPGIRDPEQFYSPINPGTDFAN